MKKLLVVFILSLFAMSGFFAYAQETVELIDPDDLAWQAPEPIENGVNCFDYYQFQSVQVSVSPEKDLFQPGESINFIGQITNKNQYPIVDGNLYVRISEKNENYIEEGNYVVDEFFGLENITLEMNEAKDVQFAWDVPIMLPKGQYNVDYFFTVGKKFNLGGLPFSNEVVAGISQFEVDSVIDGYFSFDRAAVTINGQPYKHIGNWEIVDKDSDVEFGYVLKNTLGHTMQAQVTFDTYFWDSLLEKDLIKTETRAVTIPHGESVNVQLIVPQVAESVYYVRAHATSDGINTIVNTRFAVDGGEHARLNYPAITKFPLEKGDEATLFTCFHNTSDISTKGSVSVRISDKDGKEIASASHDGDISSAMSAIKKDIKAERDYDYLKLEAEVKDAQGSVVDRYETEYSCEKMNSCKEGGVAQIMPQNPILKWIAYILLISVAVVIVLVLVKVAKGHRSIVSGIFIMFLFGGMYGFCGHVNAEKWSATSSKGYSHYSGRYDGGGDIFTYLVASGGVTLTNSITGNSTAVCEGSVTYTYNPTLVFSASGGYWDTPNGAVCSGSDPNPCISSSQQQNITSMRRSDSKAGDTLPGWIKWSSGRPTVTLSSNNNAIMQCSGMTCTAKPGQSGTVRITATFSGVQSRIYSQISTSAYTFSPSDETYGVASGIRRSDYFSKMIYDGSWHNRTNQMPLGGSTVSWDVTVGSCKTDGACNAASTKNNYAYTATSPSTPLCSAGTPSPATVSFPAGKYGASSNVTWTCAGVGGGATATCAAQRLAPAASCGTANGVMTNTQPAANLCGPGSVLDSPPGVTLQGTSWQWSCTHSINPGANPQTVTCSAPTPATPCACNPATPRTDYPYTATGPSTPLCSAGTPLPGIVNFVAGAYGAASTVNWTCSAPPCTGVGCASACMGSATCSASRMSPPQCDCGSVDTVSTTKPTIDLCNPPLSSGPTVLGNNGGWSWTCQDPSVCSGSAVCSAECVNIDIDAPANIYLNKNGNKLKVKVRVEGHQNVKNGGTCSIAMNSETKIVTVQNGGSTPEVEFDYGGPSAKITAECTLEVDCGGGTLYTTKKLNDEHTVTSLCVEKACNAQGSCQSTPKSGVSSIEDCVSTCNSTADCSKGRMIETRP